MFSFKKTLPFFAVLLWSFSPLFGFSSLREKWRVKGGEFGLHGSAYNEDNQSVFLGSANGALYCVNAFGTEIWTFPVGQPVFGVAYDKNRKRVFFGSEDSYIYGLDCSRQNLWKYQTKSPVKEVVCDEKNGVIFCSSGYYLYSLDSETGEKRWSCKFTKPITSLATIPTDRQKGQPSHLLFTAGEYLYLINDEYDVLWKREEQAGSSLGHLYYDKTSEKIFLSDKQWIYCYDLEGNRMWIYPTDGLTSGFSCDAKNNYLFYGCKDYLYCLDLQGNFIGRTFCWSYECAQPSIDIENGILFYPSRDGFLYAFNYLEKQEIEEKKPVHFPSEVESQTLLKWCVEELSRQNIQKEGISFDMKKGDYTSNSPLSSGQFLYLVSQEKLLCLDTATLSPAWTISFPSSPYPPSVTHKEEVYFSSKNGEICQIINENRLVLFEKENEIFYAPLATDNGLIYFGSNLNHLYCFDLQEEVMVWKKQIEERLDSSPPVIDHNQTVYFSTKNALYCVAKDGTMTKIFPPLPIQSPLRIDSINQIYFLSDPQTLTCIDSHGKIAWEYPDSTPLTLPTFDRDGQVYIGNSNGQILCLNPTNGSVHWFAKTLQNTPIEVAPTTDRYGQVFFLSISGEIYKFTKRGSLSQWIPPLLHP